MKKQNTIVLDWLTICTTINLSNYRQDNDFIYLSDSIIIEKTNSQSNDWGNIDRILFNGYLIAIITYNPKNLFNTTPNYVQIKVQNEDLYSKYWLNFYYALKQINSEPYSNRIDIAYDLLVDGSTIDPLATLRRIKYHKEENKPYYIKKTGRAEISEDNGTYYVGSRTSRKYIKIYNKTKELNKSSKDYIREFWVNNGMELDDNSIVIRQELTLKKELAKDINLELLTDPNYLESLLKAHCKNFYEFYKMDGKRKKTVSLIHFNPNNNTIYNKPQRVINKLPFFKRVQRNLKGDVFKLIDAYLNNNQQSINVANNSITDAINNYSLLDYFRNNVDYWVEEYRCQFAYSVSVKDFYKRIEKINLKSILTNNIAHTITLKDYILKKIV